VEDLYTNSYLLQVNDQWQRAVDECQKWSAYPFAVQNRFYERWVKPFLNKNKKIFVIVSDALRFEIGEELLGMIRREDCGLDIFQHYDMNEAFSINNRLQEYRACKTFEVTFLPID
ncbi:MAG: PglZ domain-containing protein, partial [Deltaproteobacteria bacterium]|nr:PglZ domain-containing protein [Deltaproteobacteria bacterium]